MSKTKVYQVSDLFYTQWKDLDDVTHARVFALYQATKAIPSEDPKYGYALIACLRALRKNWRLVDKINVPQAVDCFNELKFLSEPWYYFPELPHELVAIKPDPYMERSSFDQFIYSDNEFSSYLVSKDIKHLRRLAVSLYHPVGELVFDKAMVESREQLITGINEDLLMLVFFTYANVRDFVMKRCKTLLPPAGKPAQGEERKKPTPTGGLWHDIKHQAVRAGYFGDFKSLSQQNMYDVLDHLEILCREKEEKKR